MFCRKFPLLCGHAGQLPEVMGQDAPFDAGLSILKSLISQGGSKIGVLEDTDAGFGAASALLQLAEIVILKSFLELRNRTGADGIDDVGCFEVGAVGGAVEATVAGVALG